MFWIGNEILLDQININFEENGNFTLAFMIT